MLTDVTIPPSVNWIGDNAFADAEALEEIIIGEYAVVRSISVDAFAGCDNLKTITIGANQTSGWGPYFICESCPALEAVYFLII